MFLRTIVFRFVQRKGKECPNAADEVVTIFVWPGDRRIKDLGVAQNMRHPGEGVGLLGLQARQVGCASKIAETKVSQRNSARCADALYQKQSGSDRTLRCKFCLPVGFGTTVRRFDGLARIVKRVREE